MAERTSVTQVVQLGVETTPGTSVAANRFLPSVMVNMGPDASFTEVRASGNKFPGKEVLGKEWSTVKMPNQAMTYDEVVYFLSSLMGYAAPAVQGGATPTTAYLWTHNVSSTAEDTVKSFTIEQGSAVRAHKATYCQATGMTLSGDRDKVDVGCDMIARSISDGVTLTAAPTAVAQVPMLAKDTSIYIDDTSGGLGTTKLTRDLSWEVSLNNKVGPLWVVDKAQTSFVALVEQPVDATFKVMVEADAQGMGLLTAMRAGTRKFIRLDITSDELAGTGFPYYLRLDMACEIAEKPSEFTDRDGVYAIEYTFKTVHDATWGRAVTASVMNKLAAL